MVSFVPAATPLALFDPAGANYQRMHYIQAHYAENPEIPSSKVFSFIPGAGQNSELAIGF